MSSRSELFSPWCLIEHPDSQDICECCQEVTNWPPLVFKYWTADYFAPSCMAHLIGCSTPGLHKRLSGPTVDDISHPVYFNGWEDLLQTPLGEYLNLNLLYLSVQLVLRDKELLDLRLNIQSSLQGIHSALHCSHFYHTFEWKYKWVDPLRFELRHLSSAEIPLRNRVIYEDLAAIFVFFLLLV